MKGIVFGEFGDAMCQEERGLNSELNYFNQFINKENIPQAKHYIFMKEDGGFDKCRVLLYVPSDSEYGSGPHFLENSVGCTVVSLEAAKGIAALTAERAKEIERGTRLPEGVLMKFKEYVLKQTK